MSSKLSRIVAGALLVSIIATPALIAYGAENESQLTIEEIKVADVVIESTGISNVDTQNEDSNVPIGPGFSNIPGVIVIEDEKPVKPETTIKYVKANVSIRTIPSLENNTPVDFFEKGDEVEFISEENGWDKIWWNDDFYYIADRFVVDTKEEAEQYVHEYTAIFENMTEEDLDVLAKVIFLEVCGDCIEGKTATCEVILNRIASPIWPNSVKDVVFAKGQFTTASGISRVQEGQPYKNYTKCVDLSECREAIEICRTQGRTVLPYNYVYFASYSGANGHGEIKVGHQYYAAGKVGY